MSEGPVFEDLIVDNEPEIQPLAQAARELLSSVRPDARQEVETSWGGYLLFKQPTDGGNTVWDEVARLVRDSYLQVATKTMRQALAN